MTIVVDCGQHSFKAGEVGEKPRVIQASGSFRESLVDDAFWENIIQRRSQGSQGSQDQGQLIVSLPISAVRSAREELCEFLFEKQLVGKTSSACILSSTFLATLGAGLSTALVIDIGEAETRVTPVEDGYPLRHCSSYGRIGGATLTSYMSEMLQDPAAGANLGTIQHAKEQFAWVTQDFNAEMQRLKTIPAVSAVSNGKNKEPHREKGFMCGELLFDTRSGDTLPELVMTSLRLQSNINLRGKLLGNLLLVGGTAQLPGIQTRLLSEVRAQSQWVAPGHSLDSVKVHGKEPAVLAWMGGSLLAECDTKDLTITRAAYEKYGPQVVHQTFL